MTSHLYIETIKPWLGPQFILLTVIVMYHPIRYRETYPTEAIIMRLMGLMYFGGKAIQIHLIGPSFIRGYLADIGWMGIGALLIPYGVISWEKTIRWTRWSAHALFCVAWVSEMSMLLTQPSETIPGMKFQARGDVIDLMIFIFGYVLILVLAKRLELKTCPPIPIKQKRSQPRKKKRLFRP